MQRSKAGILSIFFGVLIASTGFSQFLSPKNYPQQYFQWPVGAKIALAANFGELRPNHYHMGLDCKTDQKVNMPIYAAAAGFISRVKIEPFGFGRSIMIDHPNGISTLYAHLNDFYPELEKYITEQQYSMQQWEGTIMLPRDLFKVTQGQFIAYSGNTGGSQGPHLHFEIRDTKTEKVLNPSLFNFPIPDAIPPQILRLALYDRRISTYEQSPKVYSLKKVNGIYKTAGVIRTNSNLVSFAITAYDRYTGSTNQNGIYTAVLFENGEAMSGFELDSISYDETRYLNAHIDYRTRSSGGSWLEHLSRLPGYQNGIYKATESDGVIDLSDDSIHAMKIEVGDANGNIAVLEFDVQYNGAPFSVNNNTGLVFHPGFVNVFENSNISFYLPENAIYDSFHFKFNEIKTSGQSIYQLHNTSVPVQTYFPVKIRADYAIQDTGKIMMKRSSGSKQDFKKTVYEAGWYKAAFREFGNYQLLIDTIPPSVVPVGFKDGMNAAKLSRIRFSVVDNTEEIGKFTALLDGKWLRFSNDKGRNYIYDFDEYCPAGEHELIVRVTDLCGNTTEKKFRFTR